MNRKEGEGKKWKDDCTYISLEERKRVVMSTWGSDVIWGGHCTYSLYRERGENTVGDYTRMTEEDLELFLMERAN